MATLPLTTGGVFGDVGPLTTDGILPLSTGILVESLDPAEVGDEGGWEVAVTGSLPSDQGVAFRVRDGGDLDEACYGGAVGFGEWSQPDPDEPGVFRFVVPPLPVGGPYDLYAVSEDGSLEVTFTGALTVVHRSYTTDLYSLRAGFPPPRDVGPYTLNEEPE